MGGQAGQEPTRENLGKEEEDEENEEEEVVELWSSLGVFGWEMCSSQIILRNSEILPLFSPLALLLI